jgi:hypothetical protein
MNRVMSKSSLLVGLLVAVGAAQAAAGADRMVNGRSQHGLAADVAAVAAGQPGRVINVDTEKASNVNCGETVTFQKGGKTFVWKFDSANHRAVDLRTIAPAGFIDQPFVVYVSRSEAERG